MTCGSSSRSKRTRSSLILVALSGALALGGTPAKAEPEVFQVEPEHSSTKFTVSQFGLFTQLGSFARTSGTIVLDPESRSGSFDLVVDATSIDTGWNVRDNWLRGEDMFDVAHHPVVHFRSTRLVFDQSGLVEVAGLLTLRNVTRPIVLKVERLQCSADAGGPRAGCGASAVSTIRRSDFGMGYALGLVGDEVSLSFQVTANRVRP